MKIKIGTSFSNEPIYINIVPSSSHDVITAINEAEALANSESPYQIIEGSTYEYEIDQGFQLKEIAGVVASSKLLRNFGRITPNIYVGTLVISVIDSHSSIECGEIRIEVQSAKTTYREDYRFMLEEIAEKSVDIILQHSSPVTQSLTFDLEKDARTTYQRFAFIRSIIYSEEFENAIRKVTTSPTTRRVTSIDSKSIHLIKKFDRNSTRQIAKSSNRIELPNQHPLQFTFPSIPIKLHINSSKETLDTIENRFVKFTLEAFLALCGEFRSLKDNNRTKKEASQMAERLEEHLSHSTFKEVSRLSSLPLNNTILQRKEGYREVFKNWLLCDLAAKLIWSGGEDVYSGNKRDVAVLYEYWLFFKLIETITEVFKIASPNLETLIKETEDGLGLQIKQGQYLAIDSVSTFGSRKLIVQLNYNRTYKGDQPYPAAGSWSRNLRPDYTLSIWPYEVTYDQAETEELIVHIHFDAKYKIDNFQEIYSKEVQLDQEKDEQRRGTYKRADLLKMHAYRDAIRRTAGAYVIYPGNDLNQIKKGFHEIVPGLGAFAVRPSKVDSGIEELKSFVTKIAEHLINRASQREIMSYKTYENYKSDKPIEVKGLLPESYGKNRSLLPTETTVLVAFYKSVEHLKWIEKAQLYNARIGSQRGSIHLNYKEIGAMYILLHSTNETKASKLYKLTKNGPVFFSKNDLLKTNYPTTPTQDFYLIYKLEGLAEQEFQGSIWDIVKLKEYESFRKSAYLLFVTLAELMEVLIKK